MDQEEGSLRGMTPESRRFLRVVRWGEPIIPLTIVFLMGFLRSPFAMVLSAYLAFLFWPAVHWVRHLVRRNEPERAVLAVVIGFWGLAIVAGLGGQLTLPAAALLAIIPVVVGVPFATQRLLPWIVAGSTATAAVVAALSIFPRVLGFGDWSDELVKAVVAVYVTVLVGLYAFLVWQSSSRLTETLQNMRQANEALRESERTLERKVRARTAELEEKNQALELSRRELAEARDEALTASRTKSAFLANMSHELRTPLNAIIGYSEMLQEEAEDAGREELVPDLKKILAAGRHLLGLINDVLDLSKVEAGRMEVFAERFDVAQVVQEIVTTIQPFTEKNQNRLEVTVPEGTGEMHSDLTKLRQILFNLLSNASKFTHQGTVRLAARRREREGAPWLELRVADSGIGMAPAQLARIFEPFTQADASTTRHFGGTGLGLAITKSFCEMLGGEISATSEPGKGSEFTVRLPAALPEEEAEEVEAPLREAAPARADATTVLVIDDDASARDLMRRFLGREGFRVLTAASGAEGLQLARERAPDVITLDILMPGMDGWAVLSELKAEPRLAEIPVVVVTITDDQNLGYALGASEYMTKPIDRRQLAAILHKYEATRGAAPVLIVDDDALSRALIRDEVEKAGCRVAEAENGRVALDRVGVELPSLIFLDLMMPEMDGFEVLETLRCEPAWQAIPVVVVTAKDLTPEERSALGLQTERILEKGALDRESLLAQVRELLRLRLPGARVVEEPSAGQE
jgi:signal transduction histidine kinase/CheY-like chemotaxis protein